MRVSIMLGTSKFYQSNCQPTADNLGCLVHDKAINQSGVVNWVHQFTPTFFNEAMFSLATTWRDRLTGDGVTNYDRQVGAAEPVWHSRFPLYPGYRFRRIQHRQPSGAVQSQQVHLRLPHPGRQRHQDLGQARAAVRSAFSKGHAEHSAAASEFHHNRLRYLRHFVSTTRSIAPPPRRHRRPYTGANIANTYIGLANYTAALRKGTFKIRKAEDAFYFQDNIKVTPRLTLNLGLRWQFTPWMSEANDVPAPGFDLANHAIVLSQPLANLYAMGITYPSIIAAFQNIGVKFETWDQAGLPSKKMANNNCRDWSPHLGMAYRVGNGAKSFVIRGGISRSYFPDPIYSWLDQSGGTTPLTAGFGKSYTAAAQSPDGIGSYAMRSVPTVLAGVNSAGVINLNALSSAFTPGSPYNYFFDVNQPTPYVDDWNVTLEKDIKSNMMVRTG